ncbi:MDR family oxidoreductase [Ignatzschineria cameli]|uniref:MDR family oxidoreductase n=1 Tax=Ignatzschineria cameli TaxID=2182793 RepID=UPI000D610BC3|nr:MDR family oxidoreductase [Ignatzschineria cameli]PWD87598.1 hypothetical protein DC080_01925 [Ignatzschineria cameli]
MFKALYLQDTPKFSCSLSSISLDELYREEGDTLVEVEYSTLNYKDALAITNQGKIARRFPMIPGIDLAGRVLESRSDAVKEGDRVFINGLGLGENHYGGLSERAYLRGESLLHLPENYSTFDVMAFGTAGYTAALSVARLLELGLMPEKGEILVSGATGGVGMVAIMLLSKLGFEVVALTSKIDQPQFFTQIGAQRVEDARPYYEAGRILQKGQYQGAIDVLGSQPLVNICAQIQYGGAVAACGLARGMDLPGSVAPFILRGVTLAGIDSVMAPRSARMRAWKLLSDNISGEEIRSQVEEISLTEAIPVAKKMIDGQIRGRYVVKIR